jgi:hypothetical protein
LSLPAVSLVVIIGSKIVIKRNDEVADDGREGGNVAASTQTGGYLSMRKSRMQEELDSLYAAGALRIDGDETLSPAALANSVQCAMDRMDGRGWWDLEDGLDLILGGLS